MQRQFGRPRFRRKIWKWHGYRQPDNRQWQKNRDYFNRLCDPVLDFMMRDRTIPDKGPGDDGFSNFPANLLFFQGVCFSKHAIIYFLPNFDGHHRFCCIVHGA